MSATSCTGSTRVFDLPAVRLGVVRGISYGRFGKADAFVSQTRALGAKLIRVYVYWGQVEPRPGELVCNQPGRDRV